MRRTPAPRREKILVIDDERAITETLAAALGDEGFVVETAADGASGLEKIRAFRPDIVLQDIWMPGGIDGLGVLERVKAGGYPDCRFIVMSGHGTIETAVRAVKNGAWDFVEKPLSLDRVQILIDNVLRFKREQAEKMALLNHLRGSIALVGESAPMVALKAAIARVAAVGDWVLIAGEGGTGRKLVAENLHFLGRRAAGPFVEVRGGAVPPELFESELFGFDRGAFAGADHPKLGKVNLAAGGTLYFDDISGLSASAQDSVARLLEAGAADVRVVAATGRDLGAMVAAGAFRADLALRLGRETLAVAPLRERPGDLPALVAHFGDQSARHSGYKRKEFTRAALDAMMAHPWPGNVRELRNFVERVYILTAGDAVDRSDLARAGFNPEPRPRGPNAMKWSKTFLHTLKEAPADAEIPSHVLLVRAGHIRKVAPGIFTYGALMLRALAKFEAIVREELDKRGCTQILMPMVQPRELWDESGRWSGMGDALQKMKNRNGHEFCLGATHEEVVTDYVRQGVKSHRDLPFNLYQIQTKFRDEVRPRFGLMRGREFLMKDAYSFDVDAAGAQAAYRTMYEAYSAIFTRLGAEFRVVNADSGDIGGDQSQEFHVLADNGEDQLLVGEGGYAANLEVCPALDSFTAKPPPDPLPVEEFATPGLRTIAALAKALGQKENQLVKTLFYDVGGEGAPKPVAVLLRGSDELNPIKLKNHFRAGRAPEPLGEDQVREVSGAMPGSCGPVGLRIPVLLDRGVAARGNYVVGANRDGFHLRNVNHGRDFPVAHVGDFRFARAGDLSPDGQGKLKLRRGIEVGHIFYLGTKYSAKMGATYLGADQAPHPIEMGCYGIGVSRAVQAVVEQSHDADGIVWPIGVAPFLVHICLLDPSDPGARGVAEDFEAGLVGAGLDVFVDDRQERPGVKFKDADLLGFPFRVNVGARGLGEGVVELIERRTRAIERVPPAALVERVVAAVASARRAR